MKYILIVADTNDADYISKFKKISDKDLEKIKPLIEAIKDFKPYNRKSESGFNWQHDHNFPHGHGEFIPKDDLGEKSVDELYVESGKCSEEAMEIFKELCPFGEYGVHTIEEISIFEVSKVNKLL